MLVCLSGLSGTRFKSRHLCLSTKINIIPFQFSNKDEASTVAEWVRVSAITHSEWMVPRLNPASAKMYGIFDFV